MSPPGLMSPPVNPVRPRSVLGRPILATSSGHSPKRPPRPPSVSVSTFDIKRLAQLELASLERSPPKLPPPMEETAAPDHCRRGPRAPGSAMSSLARPQSPHLKFTPTQRAKAAADRARLRSKAYRARVKPGPGTYDPRLTEKGDEHDLATLNGAETMQMSVFASTTQRIGDTASTSLSHTGDPGAYSHEHSYLAVANVAKATFNVTMQDGKGEGGFGTRQPRALTIPADLNGEAQPSSVGKLEATPPPGFYDPKVNESGLEYHMADLNGVEQMPTAAFISTTKRKMELMPSHHEDIPGPGHYEPLLIANGNEHDMHQLNGAELMKDSSFASTTKRSQQNIVGSSMRSQTGPNVGPGTYDPNNWGHSIASDQLKTSELSSQIQASAKPGAGALGFSTGAKARALPHEQLYSVHATGTPGPGQYEPRVTSTGNEYDLHDVSGVEKMQSAAFASTTRRVGGDPLPHIGDPGAYEPNHNRSILHSARRTFHSLMERGRGAFGSQSARSLRFPADLNGEAQPSSVGQLETTPPPGFYDPKVNETGLEYHMADLGGKEMMPMTAFISTTKRKMELMPSHHEDIPGPGHYEPLLIANGNEHDMHQLNGAELMKDSSFASTTKRSQQNIVGSSMRSQTGPNVGPGTYEPKMTNDGQLNSVNERVRDLASKTDGARDAAFQSTRDRNLFEWFLDEIGSFGQWFDGSRGSGGR